MVKSRKPLLTVTPFIVDNLLCSYSTLCNPRGYEMESNVPRPPIESIDDLTSTNERTRTKRTSKYTAPPNPQGDRPRSMWSLAVLSYCRNTTGQPGSQPMVFPCLLSTE